jgi:hypothetical protein
MSTTDPFGLSLSLSWKLHGAILKLCSPSNSDTDHRRLSGEPGYLLVVEKHRPRSRVVSRGSL